MKRILIATEKPFAAGAVEKINKIFIKAGYEATFLEGYTSKGDFMAAVNEVDGLIVRSDLVDRDIIDAGGSLKVIIRAGAGYDNIDGRYAAEKGIVVMNTPGQNANAVAELAIGLALYGIREQFSGKTGRELRGRTLGLHGFGFVARNVFRIARAMGMKVIVFTRYSKEAAAATGLKNTHSLEELYRKSDIVSIHVPARGEHIRSVSKLVLKELKPGAMVINTARKEVVDEEGLMQIMEERSDIQYLTDVKPDQHEAFKEKFPGRYFSTPKKAGAQTLEANNNAGIAAAEQAISFFETGDVSCRVN